MKITFQTKSGEFPVEVHNDRPDKILFEGLAHGLSLPYECATGTCGTCRGRVMSGDVRMDWPEAPGARKLKAERGDILMCQSRAHSDCLVRVPSIIQKVESGVLPRRNQGRLVDAQRLNDDVIEFAVELGDSLAFSAGQFVALSVPDVQGNRAYSMVNFEAETDRLLFVAKRLPGGGFSDWLFNGPKDGADVSVFGPLGAATFRPDTDGDLVCITGGSGIAGIMSILDHALRSGHFQSNRGKLFFGVRTFVDAFYLDALAGFCRQAGSALSVTLALSHETTDQRRPELPSEISIAHGFVHEVAATALSDRKDEINESTVGFVAGPPPMVDSAIRVLIADFGLSPQQIRYDKFG